MTEQNLTMLAIRYLAQVCEALSSELQAGRVENETSAKHCIYWGAKHIQQIAENSCENLDQQKHLWQIRDAMDWLAILQQGQAEILSRSGLPIPSERDVKLVRMATMVSQN
jgi:hypothetical protein